MTPTPMTVKNRPFSVEPLTQVMLPDGIFDTAIFTQRITCYYTNTSAQVLRDVTLYLEAIGDPRIRALAQTHQFAEIAPGASVRVSWSADFRDATPGKKALSLVAQASGFQASRTIQRIFVSRTTYDRPSDSYLCEVEEGTLRVSGLKVIGSGKTGTPGGPADCKCGPGVGPWLPKDAVLTFTPNPSYAGVHGELPFADPWWKILAAIVAAVAALVALITGALAGKGSVVFKGKFDEVDGSGSCCSVETTPKLEASVAGVASVVALAAMTVALADEADPFWRGQAATPPAAGERTLSETVTLSISYTVPPNAGVDYPVGVSWKYERKTTGQTYRYEISETQRNTHVLKSLQVEAPPRLTTYSTPLWIKARFERPTGAFYTGEQLYAFALLVAPQGHTFVLPLLDDGQGPDGGANDGTYTGALLMSQALAELRQVGQGVRGTWRAYVFAQDTNDASPDMKPEVAAQRIGGFFVASAIKISFDNKTPCPLLADAFVEVLI